MKAFIDRFSGLVKGTISGFDRIVFKGLVLPLMSVSEVMGFRSLRLSAEKKSLPMNVSRGNRSQAGLSECGSAWKDAHRFGQCIARRGDFPNSGIIRPNANICIFTLMIVNMDL